MLEWEKAEKANEAGIGPHLKTANFSVYHQVGSSQYFWIIAQFTFFF